MLRTLAAVIVFLTVGPLFQATCWADGPSLASLVDDLSSENAAVQIGAAAALGKLGPAAAAAAPALEKLFKHPSSSVRVAAARSHFLIAGNPAKTLPVLLEELRFYSNTERIADRASAAQGCGEMGLAAREAAPLLLELSLKPYKGVKLDDSVSQAAQALPKVVEDVVPVCIEAFSWTDRPTELTREQDEVSDASLRHRLGYVMIESKKPVVGPLTAALDDRRAAVRVGAALVLGTLAGREDIPAAPLLKRLKDEDFDVRLHAAQSLCQLHAGSPEGIAALAEELSNPNAIAQRRAAMFLKRLGPAAEPAIGQLIAHIVDDGHYAPSEALAEIGEAAVPELIRCLEDPRDPVQLAAAMALIWTRGNADAAVPGLTRLLSSENTQLRDSAARALAARGAAAAPCIDQLIAAVESERLGWPNACEVWSAIGTDAAKVAPLLLDRFQENNDPAELEAVAGALGKIDPVAAQQAATICGEWLRQAATKKQRGTALSCLVQLDRSAAPALAAIRTYLLSPALMKQDGTTPIIAIRILMTLGPQAAEATEDLFTYVRRDGNEYLRGEAVRALAAINPDSAKVRQRLASLAEEKSLPWRITSRAEQGAKEIQQRIGSPDRQP